MFINVIETYSYIANLEFHSPILEIFLIKNSIKVEAIRYLFLFKITKF